MGRDDNGGLRPTDGDETVIDTAAQDGGRTTQGRGGYLDGQGGDPVGGTTTSDTGSGTTR